MVGPQLMPVLALLACAAAPAAPPGCPGVADPVAQAARSDAVLLVRAAPVSEPRVVADEEALRALTRPAREDRAGPAPAPLRTDGRTFRVMEVLVGPAPDGPVVRTEDAPSGCPAPVAGRTYVLFVGTGAAAVPVSGADDPLVARLRAGRKDGTAP